MIGLLLLVVPIALVVILLVWLVGMYNALVRRRIDCDNGWSQIDVQLKRRYDLIPNLVETVKGYAAHERGTLEAVVAARSRAIGVTSDAAHAGEKAAAENMLTQALGRLIAIAEAYPTLKADQNFGRLQEELASTENKVGFARQHFNDVVAHYEESRQTFPTNLVAGAFNFEKRDYFKVEEPAAREAPKVSFT
ncbi:MAG TPA: LemA family protein [Patescibacteria group bacterium]|jgi:LemA protein|nr:LemA family protein [Patescibacteria group bacterium]